MGRNDIAKLGKGVGESALPTHMGRAGRRDFAPFASRTGTGHPHVALGMKGNRLRNRQVPGGGFGAEEAVASVAEAGADEGVFV